VAWKCRRLKVYIATMIADGYVFSERKMQKGLFGMMDKKTPPGGERSRGGANKGTGILRVET
jgi:hypothetical protein